MGFVFNFITYGGHQIDGVAAEDFATALEEDGMLALAPSAAAYPAGQFRRTRHLRRWSAARGPTRHLQPRQGGRPPPRRWGRARRSTST